MSVLLWKSVSKLIEHPVFTLLSSIENKTKQFFHKTPAHSCNSNGTNEPPRGLMLWHVWEDVLNSKSQKAPGIFLPFAHCVNQPLPQALKYSWPPVPQTMACQMSALPHVSLKHCNSLGAPGYMPRCTYNHLWCTTDPDIKTHNFYMKKRSMVSTRNESTELG